MLKMRQMSSQMNKVRTGKNEERREKEEGRKMNSHSDKACQSIGSVMDRKDNNKDKRSRK